MLNPMWLAIIIAIATGIAGLLVFGLLWLLSKHRKLKHDYDDLAEIVHGLNNDFRDLYTSTQGVDERLLSTNLRLSALDEQMGGLAEKIVNFQQVEPSNHPYSMAIQKVRNGASVSELMQTSGLSQDEAALLIRLHGAKKR